MLARTGPCDCDVPINRYHLLSMLEVLQISSVLAASHPTLWKRKRKAFTINVSSSLFVHC